MKNPNYDFKAKGLEELVIELNLIDKGNRELEEPVQIRYDSSSLPTFGGKEPEDTLGIYSWDEKHFLRCADNTHQEWWLDEREEEDIRSRNIAKYGNATVEGIKCNKCGGTLPKILAIDHLDPDFPVNKCPHEPIYEIQEEV